MKVLVINANTERFNMPTMPRDFDRTSVPGWPGKALCSSVHWCFSPFQSRFGVWLGKVCRIKENTIPIPGRGK
jgi:hypothetical protein